MKRNGRHNGLPRRIPPVVPPRGFQLGDRVRLLCDPPTPEPFKDFALIGTASNQQLQVALMAPWDEELAPMVAYPCGNLKWDEPEHCWLGLMPAPKTRIQVVPG